MSILGILYSDLKLVGRRLRPSPVLEGKMNRMSEPCDNLYPKCICCSETPEGGIMGGILIWRRFICDGCQESLVNAEIGDQMYDQVIEVLKGVWAGNASAGSTSYQNVDETS